MTIEPSASTIYCQNCGAGWSGQIDTTMHYFVVDPQFPAKTSASELINLGFEITRCPKCPIPRIDEAMLEGDDRRAG